MREGGTAFTPILDIRTPRPGGVMGQLQGSRPQLSGPRGHAYPPQGLPSPGIIALGLTQCQALAEWVHPTFPFILTEPRRDGPGPQRLKALSRAPQMRRAELHLGSRSLNSSRVQSSSYSPGARTPPGSHIWPAARSRRLSFIGAVSHTRSFTDCVGLFSGSNSKAEGLGQSPHGLQAKIPRPLTGNACRPVLLMRISVLNK